MTPLSRILAAGTATAVVTVSAVLGGAVVAPAVAAPGSPGTPSAPTVIYDESFENDLADTENQALRDYTGASGMTYTGTPYWTEPSKCNGIVISHAGAGSLGCAPQGNVDQLRNLASVLGQVGGHSGSAAESNHAVSAYTNNPDSGQPLAAGDVELQTEHPVAVPGGSRFLTFSVDVASANCYAGGARLRFLLDDGTAEMPATNSAIDVCTDVRGTTYGAYRAGRFTSDSSVLFSGTSLGIVMRNDYGSGIGNDHAYDNIRVLDVTPQLDKSFDNSVDAVPGEPRKLTFTVTNTSELAEKAGWSFTDTLPDGLAIADQPAAATTCDGGTVTAAAGGDTVTVGNGTIASGVTSCTVTVDVVSDAAGTFSNGPGNVTTTGLDLPSSSTLTYVDPPAPTAFVCSPSTIFVAQGSPTRLSTATTGGDGQVTFTPQGAVSGVTYNAIAYNEDDDFLYGIASTARAASPGGAAFPAGSLIRIGQGGVIERVGTSTFPTSSNVGVIRGRILYVNTSSGTALTAVDLATGDPDPARSTTLSTATGAPDLAFSGGYFWGITAGTGRLNRVDPDTGIVTKFTTPAVPAGASGYGAAWTFGNGNLGFSNNTTGHVIQISIADADRSDPGFVLVSSSPGPASSNNDGAACSGTPADLQITKSGEAVYLPGARFIYTLTVNNNGDGVSSGHVVTDSVPVELTDVETDSPGCSVVGHDVTCIGGTLAVGSSKTITITARVPEGQVDPVINTASILGNETDPVADNNSSMLVSELSDPSLAVTKRGRLVDDNRNGVADVGETISYTFTVDNTGNLPLTDVSIVDRLVTGVAPVTADIAPGRSVRFVAAPYTVTQRDVDHGSVDNSATATGTDPDGDAIESPPSRTSVKVPRAHAALKVVKAADLRDTDRDGLADAGETIGYIFTVTNTGNVTITDIAVRDAKVTGLDPQSFDLAPGKSRVVTADPYVVTAADAAANGLLNSAAVSGIDPSGELIDSATATVTTRTPGSASGAELPDAGASRSALHALVLGLLLTLAGCGLLAGPSRADEG